MKKNWLLFLIHFSSILTIIFSLDIIEPKTEYRPSKNIIFCSQGGGSSHHIWVMELLEELYHRGHNVSFYSTGDHLRFSKGYPMVQSFEVGGYTNFVNKLQVDGLIAHVSVDVMGFAAAKASIETYERVFNELMERFQREKPDLVICDGFVLACVDVSTLLNISVAMTSTTNFYIDGTKPFMNNRIYTLLNPTTLNESIWFRLYKNFYRLPLLRWKTNRQLAHVFAFQRKVGFEAALDAADERFRSIPKLIHNVYGIEVPREVGQLVHLVGPIMSKTFPNIDEKISNFLNTHKRTVYIAFGQYADPSPGDVKMILETLFRLKKEDALDGIIWARFEPDFLPEDIHIIESNPSPLTKENLKNHDDFLMLGFAPQFAILQHPSTIMFIGHGGLGSIDESLYSRKRIFVYPFFAEQSYNAQMIEKNGLGNFIKTENIKYTKSDYNTIYKRLKHVLLDENGKIQDAVNRFGTMLQIHSTHAIDRGADLLEECVFSSNDEGKLWYRQGVEQELNWLKRNDVDLYLVLVTLVLGGYKALGYIFKFYFATIPKAKVH